MSLMCVRLEFIECLEIKNYKYNGWCDLEAHLSHDDYQRHFFEILPSTSKKIIAIRHPSTSIGQSFHETFFFCKKICGKMVLPASQKESDELSTISKKYLMHFWIRFSDADKEGQWRDFGNNSVVNFTNWEIKQPASEAHDFAYMNHYHDGKLTSSYKSNQYISAIVCELS